MLLYFLWGMGKESREKNKRIGKEEVWWRHGKGKCNEHEDASS